MGLGRPFEPVEPSKQEAPIDRGSSQWLIDQAKIEEGESTTPPSQKGSHKGRR